MKDSICVFGDSIMKGVIFDAIRGRYTYLKNSFLNILGRRIDTVRVDNFAKFGCTITTGKKIAQASVNCLNTSSSTSSSNDCDFDWKRFPNVLMISICRKHRWMNSNHFARSDDVSESGSKPVLLHCRLVPKGIFMDIRG